MTESNRILVHRVGDPAPWSAKGEMSQDRARSAMLLTWNPDKWSWIGYQEAVEQIAHGIGVSDRWSTGIRTSGVFPGDRVFLLRLGKKGRGIVASGTVTGGISTDAHWDGSGRPTNYVELVWECVVFVDDMLATTVLENQLPDQHWRPQSSGTLVRPELTTRLEELWSRHLAQIGEPAVVGSSQGQGRVMDPARRQMIEDAAQARLTDEYRDDRGSMSAKFGHHPWTVEELVSGIDKGTIRLPDIQRPFVWPNAKVRDLIDSMYRGYPVGELMFWANKDGDHTTAIGSDTKTQDASMQVVDGQQRLTSLYAVLKGLQVWREDYSREAIKLAFNPLTGRFEVPTAIIKRQADWIADIVGVFKDPIEARHMYLDRLRDDPRHTVDSSLERDVEVAIQRLAKLREYSFQVVQIKEEVARETVAEIFVRINSEGVNLSSADFILTWMSVFWEQGRNELEKWARNSRFTPAEVVSILEEKTTWTPHNPYMSFEPGQILRVAVAVGLRRAKLQDAYNVLRGRDPRTRIIDPARREVELARLKTGQAHATRPLHWDEFLKVLERAGFRSKDMITSENTVLYTYALWIIGRIDFKVPVDELREVMARWFFMSQITGRYTSSPETRMQEDLNRLDGLPAVAAEFVKILDAQIDAAVPDDWWRVTLPNNLDTSSAGAPAYVAYIAALNILDADVLLATSKVKDWINPNRRTLKGIEKHHLFPRDYLKTTLGLKDNKKINQVANFALVEWSDNITISNQPPNVYWPHQVATKNIEAGRRIRQEEWHALPDEWITLPYEEFLDQRRRLMAKVIHEGYKRLTDPNYEPDLTRPEHLATSISPLELPTFENLVISGVLPPGSLLTPVDAERSNTVAEVTEDGFIKVGEHLCETVDRAAREDHAAAGSGWDYWQAHLDGEDEPVTLAELRERALSTA